MELIKLLTKIENKYSKYIYRTQINDAGSDEAHLILWGEHPFPSPLKINLKMKVSTVVEQGKHQGWEGDKPVVYNYIEKPLILVSNEIIVNIEENIKLYSTFKEIDAEKDKLLDKQYKAKEEAAKKAKEAIAALEDDEELLPKEELLEAGNTNE